MLKRCIAARPRPPATVRDLEIALLEEWNSIPQSLIDNLIAFMANRNGCENALSRNIQNGTDHFRLRNSQKKIFLFTSLKMTPGFESGASPSAIECSTTALYTPCQRAFALLSVGTDTKMLCLKIYRTAQIIFAFEILKKYFSSLPRRRGHLGLNRGLLDWQRESNDLPLSYTLRVCEYLLCADLRHHY
ncbi:hypothetical protein TNCV_2845281 [Trichonephila clavipes]|nr:hypothetical protein TNCV_2845281 [Trichonephila clavipes]